MRTKTALYLHIAILAFAALAAWATLSFTARSPEAAAATQANFDTKLAQIYPWLDQIPAPRALVFENGDGYKTIRLISVTNYSYSNEEGEKVACITYRYLPFDFGEDKQHCGGVDFDTMNTLR